MHEDVLEAARKDIFKKLRTSQAMTGTPDNAVHEQSVFTKTSSRSTYVPTGRIKSDVADLVGALNHINTDVHSSGTSFSSNR